MLTLFYAGALTLIALFLAFKTVQRRLGTGILLGTGESFELLQANRAAVFTHPDNTRNEYYKTSFTGTYNLADETALHMIAFYGEFLQKTWILRGIQGHKLSTDEA